MSKFDAQEKLDSSGSSNDNLESNKLFEDAYTGTLGPVADGKCHLGTTAPKEAVINGNLIVPPLLDSIMVASPSPEDMHRKLNTTQMLSKEEMAKFLQQQIEAIKRETLTDQLPPNSVRTASLSPEEMIKKINTTQMPSSEEMTKFLQKNMQKKEK